MVEALDWIVHEETGFKLDLKEAGEEDLLRKPSFLTCAESTSNWAVDTATPYELLSSYPLCILTSLTTGYYSHLTYRQYGKIQVMLNEFILCGSVLLQQLPTNG